MAFFHQYLAFYCATRMHRADCAVARCLSICLSVRLSHAGILWTPLIKVFLPSGSTTILVILYQTGWQYSDGDPHSGGVECKVVWKNHDFFTNISLYLGSDARCHRYYGRRIGNRIQYFERYQFE